MSTDPARLTRNGVVVPLRRRAFQTLRVLVQHDGAFVPYDTITAEVWQRPEVSRHAIEVTLAEIRQRLGEYGSWIVHRSKLGYALQVPRSRALVRQGWHFWSQRTRTGFDRAITCFTRAIGESPSDSAAFEGLSACYLALAIFGMRSPVEVYPRFLETHEQAALLSGLRPELRCNRAFGLCVFERRPADSEAEFLRAIDEKPSLGSTYVRLAMLYGSQRRFDEALDVVERGKQQDPLLPTLPAAEILVRCWQRDFDAALAVGRQGVELHPYVLAPRVNYAHALQLADRHDEALQQYRIASTLSPDVPWLGAVEGVSYAALGRRDEARAMLVRLEALRRSHYIDPCYIAMLHSALGQPRAAFAELDRAVAENSGWLFTLDVNPRFDALRNERGFGRLCRRSRVA